MSDAPELRSGLRAYRAGRYFEAHEEWEERWRGETDPDRRLLLQALVQLAAAAHKRASGIRPGGAPALLAKCAAKLDRLAEREARPFGLDPAALGREVRRYAHATGPEGTGRRQGRGTTWMP